MSSDSLICGIDPGLGGALAFLWPDGRVYTVIDMPAATNARGRRELIAAMLVEKIHAILWTETPTAFSVSACWIEQVASSPQMGRASAFAFGRALGILEGLVAALGWPVEWVTPRMWKGGLKVPKEKPAAVRRACELMPRDVYFWTVQRGICTQAQAEARAEAAMIAAFGLRRSSS